MSTAPLLCLCLVVVASAANDCGAGDASCAAEKDASALLQSAVSFGSGQLVDDEVSGEVQLDAGEVAATGCAGKTESQCDGAGACSWAGESCKSKCAGKSRDACKASGYCAWDGYAAGSCGEDVNSIKLGGTESKVKDDINSRFRPELLTMEHCSGTTESCSWNPCSGTTNCFHGHRGSDSWRYWDTRVSLTGSTYSKASVDVQIKCKTSELSQIAVTYKKNDLKNANVKVWYNEDIKASGEEGEGWSRSGNHRSLAIPISSTDAVPVFRMEVESKGGSASMKTMIELKNVKAWFDDCMETKQAHSQCLQVFADGKEDLRSDNTKQLSCLLGKSNPNGCTAWKECLGSETQQTLINVIKAVDKGAVDAVAFGQQEAITQASWVPNVECTAGEHPECEDLSRLDMPAFSCSCYDDLKGKDADQIKAIACPKRAMCCSWKEANCVRSDYTTLTGVVALLEHSKKTMSNRSEQVSLAQGGEEEASLDDSLSGKRCQ